MARPARRPLPAALCALSLLLLAPAACAQQAPDAPPEARSRPAPTRVGDALVGTRWQAMTLRGEPVADPSRATIDFLPGGDHVRGQVGCNRFVAPFASRADKVTIGPVRVSRVRCDDAAFQALLVDVLQRAGRAVLTEEPPALELVEPRNAPSRFVPRPPP